MHETMPKAHRRYQYFLFVVMLFLVALSVKYSAKATKPDRFGEQTRSAFLRWRGQIQDLEAGENIYQMHNYPNPPIMAMILWPLTELPPLTGALTWFWLKVAMTALAFVMLFRVVETEGQSISPNAKILAILLSAHPIIGDLTHGNVNLFIMFLVVGCVYTFQRGYDYWAGLILALAITCKVTPALFLLYFTWKRAWNVLLGCAIGLGLFVILIPSSVLGLERNWQLLHSWFDGMVRPFVVEGQVTSEHPNQSLPGFLYRMLSHEPSFMAYVNNRPTPTEYHHWIDLGRENVRWLVKGCMAAFAGLILWLSRSPIGSGSAEDVRRVRQGWRITAEASIIVLGMLLFSERTWKHHATTLVLPYTVLAYWLTRMPPGSVHKAIMGLLTLVMVLNWTTGSTLLGPRGADLALVYGVYTFSYLLLVGAIALALQSSADHASANHAERRLGADPSIRSAA